MPFRTVKSEELPFATASKAMMRVSASGIFFNKAALHMIEESKVGLTLDLQVDESKKDIKLVRNPEGLVKLKISTKGDAGFASPRVSRFILDFLDLKNKTYKIPVGEINEREITLVTRAAK